MSELENIDEFITLLGSELGLESIGYDAKSDEEFAVLLKAQPSPANATCIKLLESAFGILEDAKNTSKGGSQENTIIASKNQIATRADALRKLVLTNAASQEDWDFTRSKLLAAIDQISAIYNQPFTQLKLDQNLTRKLIKTLEQVKREQEAPVAVADKDGKKASIVTGFWNKPVTESMPKIKRWHAAATVGGVAAITGAYFGIKYWFNNTFVMPEDSRF